MINIENYLKIKHKLDSKNIKLVAVSKKQPLERIKYLYDSGHKILGENQAQAIREKHKDLPADIEWHFIGHLQTNKVKYLVPFVSLIHSVDSKKLLKEINKEALKNHKTIDCLLQIHIAQEETKYGFNEEEVKNELDSGEYKSLSNVKICGLMGMATFTDDNNQIRNEFQGLKRLFDELKQAYFRSDSTFKELSIGMSDDYEIAIDEGSTIVRIGTIIFGPRTF